MNHASSRTSNAQENLADINRRFYSRYKSDQQKLAAFTNQIKSLQLELESSRINSELLASKLRNYEPGNDPSLGQLLWCERNLHAALQRVTDCKVMLLAENLSSSKGLVKFQPFQEHINHRNKEKVYKQNQMNMQASAPFLYGSGRNGMNRVGGKEIYSSNGIVVGNSSNNYRSNNPLAASSSQSIYQSAGASFSKALISPASYNTYSYAAMQCQGVSVESNQSHISILKNIQSGQSGSTPSFSIPIHEGSKKMDMFTHKNNHQNLITNRNNNTTDAMMQNENFNTESEDHTGKGKRKVDEVNESSSWWDDGPAMAKILSSKDFVF